MATAKKDDSQTTGVDEQPKAAEQPQQQLEDKPQDGKAVVDAPSASAPAKDADSTGLTPQQKEHDTTPAEQGKLIDQSLAGAQTLSEKEAAPLKEQLDQLADEVKDTPAQDGTVTVDFGKAGKLTGCLIMSNSTAHAGGEQQVLVPTEGGYVTLQGVPASAIK